MRIASSKSVGVDDAETPNISEPLPTRHLDVYATKNGPWNPEHGDIEIPAGSDFLPSGDAFDWLHSTDHAIAPGSIPGRDAPPEIGLPKADPRTYPSVGELGDLRTHRWSLTHIRHGAPTG